MSRRSAVALVILSLPLLGAIFSAGCRRTAAEETSRSDGNESPTRVRVVTPRPGGLERTVARPATVHAFQYADLYAKLSGYLRNQKVDIGSSVAQDEVLAEVYAPEVDAAVRQAEADLAKAQAQVGVMQAKQKAAGEELKEAKVKVEQAETDVESAAALTKLRGQQYRRISKLAQSRAIEEELVDEKMAARTEAAANERSKRKAVETAKVAVNSAEARVAAAAADLADARAQVQVASAALTKARAIQSYTKIRAPFAGVVTRRSFHEGDFIREGGSTGRPILTVARTDKMRVITYVPDPDAPFTRAGQQAEVRVTSLPGETFRAPVARTAMSEDYNSRTLRTEIDLPNPDGRLGNGMIGSATIRLGADPKHFTIPSACLTGPEKDGQRFVYVVRDGKARRTAVRVTQDDGIHAEVADGLRSGDRVVEQHGPGLADGAPVTVAGAAK